MESISILIKTENCRNVKFIWEDAQETDIIFIQRHECFQEVKDIQNTFKTLYDLAIFLNKRKLYGYLNKHFLRILKIFHKYLEKNNNVSTIYFYIEKSLLLWKMCFSHNNIGLYKYILTLPEKNLQFFDIIVYSNKAINDKEVCWFDFTHDLLFYV